MKNGGYISCIFPGKCGGREIKLKLGLGLIIEVISIDSWCNIPN
jgi:hypothetical protein